MENRPRGRKTNVTGKGTIKRRGEGLNTGPVGSGRPGGGNTSGRPVSGDTGRNVGGNPGGGFPSNNANRADSGTGGDFPSNNANRAGGGAGGGFPPDGGSRAPGDSADGYRYNGTPKRRRSILPLIIILLIIVFIGSKLLSSPGGNETVSGTGTQAGQTAAAATSSGYSLSPFYINNNSTSTTGGWSQTKNTGKLDRTVASGAREKRTVIKGNGNDTVTIMVYMCGTDLESRSGMATSDLLEMTQATIGDNVNIIVYTGGCTAWKNNVISNKINQIYQIKNGGLIHLGDDAARSMTDPAALTEFISWCSQAYPANRRELIFWDHGGGSLTGYGYDEKYKNSGSMTLANINTALKNAGVTFDFIGFDACLMATVETGLMLDDYADYMIASEETEPGVGWYYTNWLTQLSQNTSMSTLDIGKKIADDFVSTCAQKCAGQKTTLSLVDLAELSVTVPPALTAFSKDTSKMIQQNEYQTVSAARSGAREFCQSSQLDQIDFVHFASKMGTEAGNTLAKALLGAVKYNQTSSDMTYAYGLSVYFPQKKTSKVDTAVSEYYSIGMDEEYTRCIQQFASMEVGGQASAGGSFTGSPLSVLLGGSGAGSSSNVTTGSDAISQLLNAMLNGDMNISELDSSNTGFFSGRSLDIDQMAEYISLNQFAPSNLVWKENSDGELVMSLPDDQWKLVHDLCLSVYYDDGEGYVDLGLDNVYDFDDDGNLRGSVEGTWLAINGQAVAYYYDSTVDDGETYCITGHVPAMLNGERVNLMIVFDNANPYGTIVGAASVYENGETDTVAKNMISLEEGDILDFICDYYSYSGDYDNTYYLGDPMAVTADMEISNVELDASCFCPMYRFTDTYQQIYWTDVF